MPPPGQLPEETRGFPRGVANSAGTRGYVVSPAGMLHVVNLDAGWVLARRPGVLRALGFANGRLVALTQVPHMVNAVRVLVMNPEDLTPDAPPTRPLVLPDWVNVTSVDAGQLSFDAWLQGTTVLVTWEAQALYNGGAPPPAAIEQAARRNVTGAAAINVVSGSVSMLDEWPSPLVSLPPAIATLRSQTYNVNGNWFRIPWLANSTAALLDGNESDPTAKVELRRWDAATSTELPRIVIASGSRHVFAVTPDGRYVFVRNATAEPMAQPWRLFAVASGDELPPVPYQPGAGFPAILNSVVYFLVEQHSASAVHTRPRRRPSPGDDNAQNDEAPASPALRVLLNAWHLERAALQWPALLLDGEG